MLKQEIDPAQVLADARREQILQAAAQVFAAKGFHRATVRDVARAAGVADGTIYNYFENKTALLLGILDRLNETERRDDDLARAIDMDLRDYLREYFTHRLQALSQTGLDTFRAVLSEVLADAELRQLYLEKIIEPTFALAEGHFMRLVDTGKVRTTNVPLTLRVISATFLGLIILRMMGEAQVKTDWDEIPELVTTLLLDGLQATQGD